MADPTPSPSPPTLTLRVKPLRGAEFDLEIPADCTVPDLQSHIESASSIPVSRQRVIYQGKVLKSDRSVSDYGVENGDALHLIVRDEPSQQPQSQADSQSAADGPPANDAFMPAAASVHVHIGPPQPFPPVVQPGTGTAGIFSGPLPGQGGDLGQIIGSVISGMMPAITQMLGGPLPPQPQPPVATANTTAPSTTSEAQPQAQTESAAPPTSQSQPLPAPGRPQVFAFRSGPPPLFNPPLFPHPLSAQQQQIPQPSTTPSPAAAAASESTQPPIGQPSLPSPLPSLMPGQPSVFGPFVGVPMPVPMPPFDFPFPRPPMQPSPAQPQPTAAHSSPSAAATTVPPSAAAQPPPQPQPQQQMFMFGPNGPIPMAMQAIGQPMLTPFSIHMPPMPGADQPSLNANAAPNSATGATSLPQPGQSQPLHQPIFLGPPPPPGRPTVNAVREAMNVTASTNNNEACLLTDMLPDSADGLMELLAHSHRVMEAAPQRIARAIDRLRAQSSPSSDVNQRGAAQLEVQQLAVYLRRLAHAVGGLGLLTSLVVPTDPTNSAPLTLAYNAPFPPLPMSGQPDQLPQPLPQGHPMRINVGVAQYPANSPMSAGPQPHPQHVPPQQQFRMAFGPNGPILVSIQSDATSSTAPAGAQSLPPVPAAQSSPPNTFAQPVSAQSTQSPTISAEPQRQASPSTQPTMPQHSQMPFFPFPPFMQQQQQQPQQASNDAAPAVQTFVQGVSVNIPGNAADANQPPSMNDILHPLNALFGGLAGASQPNASNANNPLGFLGPMVQFISNQAMNVAVNIDPTLLRSQLIALRDSELAAGRPETVSAALGNRPPTSVLERLLFAAINDVTLSDVIALLDGSDQSSLTRAEQRFCEALQSVSTSDSQSLANSFVSTMLTPFVLNSRAYQLRPDQRVMDIARLSLTGSIQQALAQSDPQQRLQLLRRALVTCFDSVAACYNDGQVSAVALLQNAIASYCAALFGASPLAFASQSIARAVYEVTMGAMHAAREQPSLSPTSARTRSDSNAAMQE